MKTNFKVGQIVYYAFPGQIESAKGKIIEVLEDLDHGILFESADGTQERFALNGALFANGKLLQLSHTPYIVKLEGYSQIELKELPDLKKDDLVMVSNKGENWIK